MDAKSGSLASSSQQATPGAAKDNVTKPKVRSDRCWTKSTFPALFGALWSLVHGPNVFSADVLPFTAVLRMQGRKIEARRVYAVFESGGSSIGL
ncbi:hypothetical protein E4U37_004193 [Claviceps purpurea]|nr:hypothetical protein E4U37_004193 [Claviceps purpurea]